MRRLTEIGDIKEKRLLSTKEVQRYCGIGKNTARDWGREIGAERRIGRRVLYDKAIIDRALDNAGAVLK